MQKRFAIWILKPQLVYLLLVVDVVTKLYPKMKHFSFLLTLLICILFFDLQVMGLVMVDSPDTGRRKGQGIEDDGVGAKKTTVYLVLMGVIQMVLRVLVMVMMAGEGIGAEVDMTGESWEAIAAEVWIQMEEEGDLEVHMTEERCVILLFMNCLSDCYLTALFHHTGSHIG